MILAIRRVLADAGLSPEQVVHVNAHATSTPAGDVVEAQAIAAALGDAAAGVVVSATKSMTGHLLGGAGAVESVAAILALRERVAPPTINLEDPERRRRRRHRHRSRRNCSPRGHASDGRAEQLVRLRRRTMSRWPSPPPEPSLPAVRKETDVTVVDNRIPVAPPGRSRSRASAAARRGGAASGGPRDPQVALEALFDPGTLVAAHARGRRQRRAGR